MKQATISRDPSLSGEVYPVAAMICAIGFFMRIFLSGPVLNMIGIDYGGEDGSILGKIHPSSYVVILSFIVLLLSRGNPFDQMIRVARTETAFFSFFLVYLLIISYWVFRGPGGVGQIIDIHIVAPMCAIVFAYAPKSYCRNIIYLFGIFAVINSLVGIYESATQTRIFSFDPDWEVLKQDYFRSSAFLGHPLTNAAFSVVAMFTLMSIRMVGWKKIALLLVMLSSLVAFGSRSSFVIGITGSIFLGVIGLRKYTATRNLSVIQLMMIVLMVFVVPGLCAGLLYGVLHSGIGDRLLAYNNLNDESAGVRLEVWNVFKYMTPNDMIFGGDGDRIMEIASHVGVQNPMSDIENPWILMFMFLGGIMFSVWFVALAAYVWRLQRGASAALKLALISYFFIASTSNSFGRKDPIFMLIAGIMICGTRMYEGDKEQASS